MRMPLRDRIALAAALLAPLVIALVLVPFRTHMTSANLALILVVVVVAVAALGSRAAGVLAALSAAAWFDFFLTHPYQRFTISHGDDITTTLLLLAVGVAVSQLSARARTLKLVTVTDAAHLARIHDTASLVQAGASPYAVVDQVRQQLVEILGLRSCRFEHGTLLATHITSRATPRTRMPYGVVRLRTRLGAQPRGKAIGRGSTKADQPISHAHRNTSHTPSSRRPSGRKMFAAARPSTSAPRPLSVEPGRFATDRTHSTAGSDVSR
ncbi:DUF4118 domain-containing protein [Streptomyces sp. NBC_00076]|uniref:DUF4118 domain-containing protein n=1 Tax=Streptomyces sp. NBC_00076 TaxID=2975642 RepID=UPI0032514E91